MTPYLTKPQRELLAKALSGPLAPYGGQWPTFYRLKRAGLMDYAGSYRNVVLTEAGHAAIASAQHEGHGETETGI